MKYVEQHDQNWANGDAPYSMSLGVFSDWTKEEMTKMMMPLTEEFEKAMSEGPKEHKRGLVNELPKVIIRSVSVLIG